MHWRELELVTDPTSNNLLVVVPQGSHSKCVEFELQSLKMCLDPIDLVYPTYYDSKSDSFDVTF
jgi:hypothetical protein